MKMSEISPCHVIATEVVLETGKSQIVCEACNITFAKRGNLFCHLRKYHQLQVQVQATQTCGLCYEKFRTMSLLHEHMQNQHSVTLKFVHETFYSEKDFKEWKDKIEKESLSSFIYRNSSDNKESGTIMSYYVCHRSGQFKSKQNRVRHVKASGSIKSGSTCPAFIKVFTQTVDGISEIKVQYQSVHIGHDMDSRKLRLSKKERENLAACLQLGIPMDKILQHARQNLSPTNRYSFLTRKHLHNIRRDFKIPLNDKIPNLNATPNIVDASDSSNSFQNFFEFEVSSHEEIQANEGIQDNEEMQALEKNTAVSSLLLLQNPNNYSEDFNNRKERIINQLKELQLRIEQWDSACPLPDAEEHIRALNTLLDISASSNGAFHLEGTLTTHLSTIPTNQSPTKRRKVTNFKERLKKTFDSVN